MGLESNLYFGPYIRIKIEPTVRVKLIYACSRGGNAACGLYSVEERNRNVKFCTRCGAEMDYHKIQEPSTNKYDIISELREVFNNNGNRCLEDHWSIPADFSRKGYFYLTLNLNRFHLNAESCVVDDIDIMAEPLKELNTGDLNNSKLIKDYLDSIGVTYSTGIGIIAYQN
jgi:hypothetical protein